MMLLAIYNAKEASFEEISFPVPTFVKEDAEKRFADMVQTAHLVTKHITLNKALDGANKRLGNAKAPADKAKAEKAVHKAKAEIKAFEDAFVDYFNRAYEDYEMPAEKVEAFASSYGIAFGIVYDFKVGDASKALVKALNKYWLKYVASGSTEWDDERKTTVTELKKKINRYLDTMFYSADAVAVNGFNISAKAFEMIVARSANVFKVGKIGVSDEVLFEERGVEEKTASAKAVIQQALLAYLFTKGCDLQKPEIAKANYTFTI